jgi:enamine deaminase RidA (YjgF/YER057c/UK114 family)
MGLVLPDDVRPAGDYVPAVKHGSLVYVAGQLPRQGGGLAFRGRVGAEIDLGQAQQAARIAALRLLAAAAGAAGSLDVLERVVELRVYVRGVPDFENQTLVADAASQLLTTVLGSGGHARTAIGVAELPRSAPVEIAGIVAVRVEG